MGFWTMAGRVGPITMAGVAGLVVALGAVGAARADDYLDKANALYSNIETKLRSDLVILPVLHVMEDPPKEPGDFLAASLMTTQNVAWGPAEAWAKAKPQQDAIEALKTVTAKDDGRDPWAFGQPYGAAAVDPKFVDMKLYTELGEDNTLAAAQFLYLPAVRKLEILCHVEATRLLAEGKGDDALDLMRRWALFSYQIASRQMLKEKLTGMEMLGVALARMRDLAYSDMMADKHTMTADGIVKMAVNKIGEKNPVNVERLELPAAERLAAEQLVSRTFQSGGGPNPGAFSRVFARVAAGERGLRRFSESAKWATIQNLHGNYADTMQRIHDVFGDWNRRWELDQWDPLQELPTDYARLDKVRFAALDLVMGDVGQVFPMRRALRAEWVGTRASLGVYAYWLSLGSFPPRVESIAPRFVGKVSLMDDPFDKDAKEDRGHRLAFVRAAVDNVGTDGVRKPVVIRVFPKVSGVELPNFEAKVMAGQFVMYSAGPDGNQNGGSRATQMIRDEHGDYLVWPPVLSLVRQYRIDNATKPEDRP